MTFLPFVTSLLCIFFGATAEVCTSQQCFFELDIRWARTMTHRYQGAGYNVALNGTKLQLVGNFFRKNDPNLGIEVDPSKVHTADGYPRNIIEVNGQFPGPPIEVMEGSEVVVKVHNNLDLQSISIHWHGIHQRGTPWMDGVPYVSQCPISPRHSFVYRFKASPAGTHWYHSHMVSQRLDGLYGMFIVHKKIPEVTSLPLLVTDWYHVDATTLTVLNPFDIHNPGTGEFDMTDLSANHNLRFGGSQAQTAPPMFRTTGADGHYHKHKRDLRRYRRNSDGNMTTNMTATGHNMGNMGSQPGMGNMNNTGSPTPNPHSGHNMMNAGNMSNMGSQDSPGGVNTGNNGNKGNVDSVTPSPHPKYNMTDTGMQGSPPDVNMRNMGTLTPNPHAGHNMGNMGTPDPHAGHNMGNMGTPDPHAGHNMGNMETPDPHAGHNMGNMETPDPHAGHNMGNMGTPDPHAGHNMGNMGTPDPHAGHNMDHSMHEGHEGHGNHNLFSPYSPAHDDLYVVSGLINGKGQYGGNKAPLTRFVVNKGQTYRIRVVNAGAHLAMQVSLDQHKLKIIELDGQPVKSPFVDAVVVFPGERLDAEFVADQWDDNYWLRADGVHGGHTVPSSAILRYTGADQEIEPTTRPRLCTSPQPCIHFNCPEGYYASNKNIKCVSVDNLKSDSKPDPSVMTNDGREVSEFFLNLGFNFGPSFNGYKYKPPSIPFFQGRFGEFSCKTDECEQGGCECTYAITVPFNRTVQLVLTNYDMSEEGTPLGHHSTHLHGHSFYVIKLGYPVWDKNTGIIRSPNHDIDCGDSLCRGAAWRTKPDLNLVDPVLKDTVIVPSLGYAVIRFKSDNPGMWLIHCHVDPHSNGGMTVLMKEAEGSIVAPPSGFPTCGHYDAGSGMMDTAVLPIGGESEHNSLIQLESKSLIAIILGSVAVGAVLIIITVIIGKCVTNSARNKNVTE